MKTELHPRVNGNGAFPADHHADVLRAIADALSGVRFGSVEIIIQDSRVIQIERKEKFRFDKNGRA